MNKIDYEILVRWRKALYTQYQLHGDYEVTPRASEEAPTIEELSLIREAHLNISTIIELLLGLWGDDIVVHHVAKDSSCPSVFAGGVVEVKATRFADFTDVELMLMNKGQIPVAMAGEIQTQIELNRQEYKRDYRAEQSNTGGDDD